MTKKKRTILAVASVLAVVLVGVGYYVYELIDTDAPDSVSTSAALEVIAGEPETNDDTTVTSDTDADTENGNVIAEWTVDNEYGEFDFETASGSFAGFRVDKAFFSGVDAVAVGRSGEVTGTVLIGENELTSASITVDMTELVSDESAREDAIKEAVLADTFPTASFEVTTAVALDTDKLATGETVSVDVVGNLTIAGVTNEVTIPIEATVISSGFGVIIGSTDLVWADYDVVTPTSRVADVADEGTLEFQLIVDFQ